MAELWQASIAGINLLPTVLLGLTLLYWLIVIIGGLDLEFLDFSPSVDADLDVDVDLEVDAEASVDTAADGSSVFADMFNSFLLFFNIGQIPLMVVLSITILAWWIISVSTHHILGWATNPLFMGLALPAFFLALFMSKGLTQPLKKFLKTSTPPATQSAIGGVGKLLGELSNGRFAQVEIKTKGAPITANAVARNDVQIPKGSQVIVVDKDKEKNLYIVEPFEGWEE